MLFCSQSSIRYALLALLCACHSAVASQHHAEQTQHRHPIAASEVSTASPPQRFIRTLNQSLQQQNQQLTKDRGRIKAIAQHYLHNDDISEADFNWLKEITSAYQLEPHQRGDQAYFKALLLRVDTVPASLAIAQAIIESGWGEASSTAKAHNPFGLQSGHRQLKNFPSQQAAVAYYVKLLNTSQAYEPFRKLRAQARSNNKKLQGEHLANGLTKYSTQGHAYIKKVQNTININQLAKLD